MEESPKYQPPVPDYLQPQEEKRAFQRPPILKYFTYDHLPGGVLEISREFSRLADQLVHAAEYDYRHSRPVDMAELTTALRKLLEAKDAAVRAFLEARR